MMRTRFAYFQGKPVVEVELHGRHPITLKMIVDSGADLITVPPRICRRLGWKELRKQEIVVPGARISVPIYAGDVELENVRMEVKVMAMDLPGFRTAEGLLGREFIDHFEVCFKGGEQVSFEPLV